MDLVSVGGRVDVGGVIPSALIKEDTVYTVTPTLSRSSLPPASEPLSEAMYAAASTQGTLGLHPTEASRS